MTKAAKIKLNKMNKKKEEAALEETRKRKEEEEQIKEEKQKRKELEEQINQFDGDYKFPSSFESLLNSYSLIQNIDRNYR